MPESMRLKSFFRTPAIKTVFSILLALAVTVLPGMAASTQDAPPILLAQNLQDNQQVDITGTLNHTGSGDRSWYVETSDNQTFRIQNPQNWTKKSWFQSNAVVRIRGTVTSLNTDPTIVASRISKTTATSTNGVVRQIEQQVSQQANRNKFSKYIQKVPFIGKWLNRTGL